MPEIVLNIGCGDVLGASTEERFVVNIDVVPPENPDAVTMIDSFDDLPLSEKPLFLLDDAVRLSWVPDDIADEIHAYHLIEHFHPYEVPEILARWYKALKPGGVLALEQPDVIKCAINLLQLATTNIGHIAFNIGLLGFYGAQEPEKPLMSHKYGWTFKTLAPVLLGAGFSEIEEYDAQTHAKTSRDFRIQCKKGN